MIRMRSAKFRAVTIVFIVGFALGLSVFAASRLFVRSVLSTDAAVAAEELAARLAEGKKAQPRGRLSSILRYTRFGADGEIVEVVDLGAGARSGPDVVQSHQRRAAERARDGAVVVEHAALLPSLVGLAEPAMKGVAVPIVSD